MASHDKILIVDFGSQVTQLIARRVREEKVYCEIVPYQKAAEAFAAIKPKAVILSGGPASVLDKGAPLAQLKRGTTIVLPTAGEIANFRGKSLSVVDLTKDKEVARVEGIKNPRHIVLSPDGTESWRHEGPILASEIERQIARARP